MNYKVNPDSLSAVFMVPSQIVDQHIKLAGGQQLKVLLWTLRHAGEGFDMEKMCRDLNFSVPDAQDYLQYWVETGILVSDGNTKAVSAFAPTKPEKKKSLQRKKRAAGYRPVKTDRRRDSSACRGIGGYKIPASRNAEQARKNQRR